MTTFRLTIVASFLFCAVTAASGQEPLDRSLTSNPVFEKHCAKCHGKTAEGRHFGGPALISEKAAAVSADDLRNMINNGKGRMPKYASKLTPDEIDQLVEQIKAANKK